METQMVDVCENTLSMDPHQLALQIERDKPDIVIMTNMGGYTGIDTMKVRELCSAHGIVMIEDSANAFGQKYNGSYSGTIGAFGIYSFSNPKLLTAGEGGAIVSKTNTMDLIFEDYIYQGGWYRSNKEDRRKGLNFSMANWLCQLLLFQLYDIEQIMADRRDMFLQYKDECEIKGKTLFEFPSDNEYYSPSFYCFRIPMLTHGIAKRLTNVTHQRYKSMGSNFPVSELLEKELVYLPIL